MTRKENRTRKQLLRGLLLLLLLQKKRILASSEL
jgi:hypothetical protein